METMGLHHVGLTVQELSQSTQFFVEALGWRVVREKPEYPAAFVSDGVALITLWQADVGPTAFDRKRNVGLHHLAIRVASKTSLYESFSRIQAWPGAEIEFPPQTLEHGRSEHFIFREPGGIRMELVWAQ